MLILSDGSVAYVHPRNPVSDDGKKIHVVTKAGAEGTMRDKGWCSAKIDKYSDPVLTVGGVGGKMAVDVRVDVGGRATLVHLSPRGDPVDSIDIAMPGGVRHARDEVG